MKGKTKDCPLAPVGNYQQGEEGARLYVPPCKDWDGEICHWFDLPCEINKILDFVKRERMSK